jgi:hypothetical protein
MRSDHAVPLRSSTRPSLDRVIYTTITVMSVLIV